MSAPALSLKGEAKATHPFAAPLAFIGPLIWTPSPNGRA